MVVSGVIFKYNTRSLLFYPCDDVVSESTLLILHGVNLYYC